VGFISPRHFGIPATTIDSPATRLAVLVRSWRIRFTLPFTLPPLAFRTGLALLAQFGEFFLLVLKLFFQLLKQLFAFFRIGRQLGLTVFHQALQLVAQGLFSGAWFSRLAVGRLRSILHQLLDCLRDILLQLLLGL